MASSRTVVLAALVANGAIAIMKFVGYLLTGSPAMLSETYHSISDTGNQVFLLIGIRYGSREADRRHPFGYGKAQFFYSFLVSVLLFGIAGWESISHGYHEVQLALQEGATLHAGHDVTLFGQTFPPVYVNYVVLIAAIVFETWALMKARAGMKRQMREHGWDSYREAFKKTSDVTTLTALTEDTIALAGAGFALVGVYLSRTLNDPIYDAASAVLIGIMLMGFAVALAWENKRLILGESIPKDDEAELERVATGVDGVERLVDFRTVYFGPNRVVVMADAEFAEGLSTGEIDDVVDEVEEALVRTNDDVIAAYVEVEGDGESSLGEGDDADESAE